jgi:hypothetical protein
MAVSARIRSSRTEAAGFRQNHGVTEYEPMSRYDLNLVTFNLDEWQGAAQKVEAIGIAITTLAEELVAGSLECRRSNQESQPSLA